VVKMGEIVRTYSTEYLLVGDLPHSTLQSITEGVERMEGIETIDLQYSLSTSTASKSVLLLVNARRKELLKSIDDYLLKRSAEGDFLLIRGMGV